ncbi:hypothetical protein U1Q18_037803 [Sarracenia purpurea var. burkii]
MFWIAAGMFRQFVASEECFPPLVGIKGFQTVSPPGADIQVAVKQEFKLSNSREVGIISEAISLHSHLPGVCEDVLLDDKRIQTARLGKESIEIELQRVRKGPKPFNSAKMADLAACIQRLKGSNSSFMYKNGVGAGAKKYEAPVEVKKDDVYVEAIDEGEADGSDDYESGSSIKKIRGSGACDLVRWCVGFGEHTGAP